MKKSDILNNRKIQTQDSQNKITPELAIEMLKKGNARFVKNRQLHRNLKIHVQETANGQYPYAIILSCIDSRVPVEIIFDQGIGDVFSVRIAGNFVNEDILGSMEFACKFAGTKLIVVLSHTSCGAVKGACDSVEAGNLTQLLNKIMPAVNITKTNPGERRDSGNMDFVNRVAVNNLDFALKDIHEKSPVLHELYEDGQIGIAKAIYHVESGKVEFLK